MRALWSGEIAFALVTIPTKLYAATRNLTPKFHLVHKACGTRVQMVRRCPKCEVDLSWDEIDKAFEVAKDEYARVTKEEIAEAESDEPKGTIEIVQFIKPAEVDLSFIETSYWVSPGGKSSKSFALLREVLEQSEHVALAKVALRSRTRLALLRPRGKLFSLDMIRFADEVVDANEIEVAATKPPSEKEMKLARSLVTQLTGKFDPEKHPDEYRARITALVEEKIEKHQTVQSGSRDGAPAKHSKSNVIDLSELLRRSLKAKGSARASEAKRSPQKAKVAKRSATSRPAHVRAVARGS